jgi:hypothetical protein
MNAFQMIELGHFLQEILREKAKSRMSLGWTIIGLGNGNKFNSGQNERGSIS